MINPINNSGNVHIGGVSSSGASRRTDEVGKVKKVPALKPLGERADVLEISANARAYLDAQKAKKAAGEQDDDMSTIRNFAATLSSATNSEHKPVSLTGHQKQGIEIYKKQATIAEDLKVNGVMYFA